jgi:hypothetical protein
MASTSMAKPQISVRLNPQTKLALEQLAAVDRRSISSVAELLLEASLRARQASASSEAA